MAKYVRPSSISASSAPSPVRVGEDAFGEGREALHEYMTCDKYDDGKGREVCTLLFLVDGGILKACLNDRANGRSCWVSGCSVEDVLGRLEGVLAGDTAEWRANQSRPTKKR